MGEFVRGRQVRDHGPARESNVLADARQGFGAAARGTAGATRGRHGREKFEGFL